MREGFGAFLALVGALKAGRPPGFQRTHLAPWGTEKLLTGSGCPKSASFQRKEGGRTWVRTYQKNPRPRVVRAWDYLCQEMDQLYRDVMSGEGKDRFGELRRAVQERKTALNSESSDDELATEEGLAAFTRTLLEELSGQGQAGHAPGESLACAVEPVLFAARRVQYILERSAPAVEAV